MDGVAADQEAVERLVGRLDDFRVTGIAQADGTEDGAGEAPAVAATDAATDAATFTVTDDEGTYQLRLSGSREGPEYQVSSDRLAGRYTVAAYIAEQLLADAEDLAAKAGEPGDGGPDG